MILQINIYDYDDDSYQRDTAKELGLFCVLRVVPIKKQGHIICMQLKYVFVSPGHRTVPTAQ